MGDHTLSVVFLGCLLTSLLILILGVSRAKIEINPYTGSSTELINGWSTVFEAFFGRLLLSLIILIWLALCRLGFEIEINLNAYFYRTNWWVLTKLCL
jgi:hypothetical protein